MPDREKVIKGLNCCCHTDGSNCAKCPYDNTNSDCTALMSMDVLALLKEQPQIVLCKDCVHRGNAEKCVLAAIAAEKGYPLFMLDNRGEWYCADGERSVK